MIERESVTKTSKEWLLGYLNELLAVEMLEYHNMNWLSGDVKTRSEKKMELIREAIDTVYKNA